MYYAGNYEKTVEASGDIEEYDYIYTPEDFSVIAVQKRFRLLSGLILWNSEPCALQ
jgi:hypothetical protein